MLISTLRRNWWALAIRGVVAIAFGLVTLFWPGISLAALILYFAVFAILDGVFNVVASVRTARGGGRWGALLLEGVVSIAAGVATFAWPGLTALVLLYLIAAWAIFTGVLELVSAATLRQFVRNEWLLILAGVASVALGVLLILNPGAGVLAVLYWIGAYAIIFGAAVLALSFRLRSLSREAQPPSFGRHVPA